jgi:hypothetical protein
MNKKLIEKQLEFKLWENLKENLKSELKEKLVWNFRNSTLWRKICVRIKWKLEDKIQRQLNEQKID